MMRYCGSLGLGSPYFTLAVSENDVPRDWKKRKSSDSVLGDEGPKNLGITRNSFVITGPGVSLRGAGASFGASALSVIPKIALSVKQKRVLIR